MQATRRFVDHSGKKFGRWTVLKFVEYRVVNHKNGERHSVWKCRCECGVERDCVVSNLQSGRSRSCGCLTKDRAREMWTKHGYSSTEKPRPQIYSAWLGMRARCYTKSSPRYERYGGRGIKVCERWNDFKNFLDDMGSTWKQGLSLGRKNNYGDYEPSNCSWETDEEQMRNTCRSIKITLNGETKTLTDWAASRGIKPDTAFGRYYKNLPIERVLDPSDHRPQSFNTIRNIVVEFNGQRKSLFDWALHFNLAPEVMRARWRDGWHVPKLFKPLKRYPKKAVS